MKLLYSNLVPPISDSKIAKLLQKIDNYQPRAIGLDIYRDLAVSPGRKELEEVFEFNAEFNWH